MNLKIDVSIEGLIVTHSLLSCEYIQILLQLQVRTAIAYKRYTKPRFYRLCVFLSDWNLDASSLVIARSRSTEVLGKGGRDLPVHVVSCSSVTTRRPGVVLVMYEYFSMCCGRNVLVFVGLRIVDVLKRSPTWKREREWSSPTWRYQTKKVFHTNNAWTMNQ